MKHYLLEGGLNEQALRDLSAFFNENSEEQITVFLDTNGGFSAYAHAMAIVIDAHNQPVKLIALNSIKSAGADLFFRVNCERVILPMTTGLVHCSGLRVRTAHSGRIPDPIEQFDHSELKRGLDDELSFWRIAGLSEKELKDYKAGRDVMLTTHQLKRMVEIQSKGRKNLLKK